MFSRVLGYLASCTAGRFVEVYNRLTGQETVSKSPPSPVDRFVATAVTTAVTAALPLPLRIPAVLALTYPEAITAGRELILGTEVQAPAMRSLDCYFRAASQSDPILLSPFGTMPYEACLRP